MVIPNRFQQPTGRWTDRGSSAISQDALKKQEGTKARLARGHALPGAFVLTLPAKLTRPQLAKVHPRGRLFGLLDRAIEASGVWIDAVPGSGKTTLAVSWLQARARPCLWYQVDAGDADLATFFHYLGQAVRHAAPRHKRPLPHLTPEYLGSLEIFTRHLFEEIFRRVPAGTVLVFDNVQDAGAQSALHDVLRVAFECVPSHVRMLCLSRAAPPAALARLRANGSIAVFERDAIRLTLEEAQAIASLRGTDDTAKVTAIHERTLGWTAGLVLMLEGEFGGGSALDASHPESLFGYFASEVLQRLDETARDVLTRGAILPKMRASDVQALTGNEQCERFLADLAQRNYFTYQLSPRERVYEYHRLFREFLLARLRQTLKPTQLRRLQSDAARLLDAAGLAEDAATLWSAAADWEALTPHILKHAGRLVAEGRSHVVEGWLAAMPAEQLRLEPWLQYWAGICRLAFDPARARSYLETAFMSFERAGDVSGTYETWASIIDSFVYEWNDFHPLDHWLQTFSRLRHSHPEFPSAAIEAHVSASVFNALMWRRPSDLELPQWAERVKRLTLESVDVKFRVVAGNHLVLYYLWMGKFASATAIIEALRPVLRVSRTDPLVRLTWYVMEAMHAWFIADSRTCFAAVSAGSELAVESGVHLHDLYLYAQAVYGGLSLNEPAEAARYLERMAGVETIRHTDRALLQYQRAAAAWCRGDFSVAVEHVESAARMAAQTGAALLDGFCHIELALFLFSAGHRDEAAVALERGRHTGRGMNHVQYLGSLYGAWFALEQGDERQSRTLLREAFALAATQGYVNAPHWSPTMMARLCAMALEHDIEPEYARRLIRRRHLVPPTDGRVHESWPWRVQIHALGPLRLKIAGVIPTSARKSPLKLLELLTLLIASGEAGITAERAMEALRGTKSREALRVALYRLRGLLESEDSILTEDGRIVLNPSCCWVDAWAFEHALDANTPYRIESAERALALYRGPFVNDENTESWALAYRERLHSRYVRSILDLGARLERLQQFDRALDCYERGLEHDNLSEAFYQRIIVCYTALGRRAEALSTYTRCRERLRKELGVDPSEQTQSLLKALLDSAR